MRRQKTPMLSDFHVTPRIAYISGLALIVGILCALIAVILMKMIGLVTNLAFYHRFSLAFIPDSPNHLGWSLIFVPIIGGLIIGVMARYGSEKIRGHGIPEALEAILIGKSLIKLRVAILKPISAAISIGTGGPFGAEGPIIMTGGSVASLFAQFFPLTASERKILLVAGAAGGMSATFAAPVASVLFAVELLVFEMRPRSLVPIAIASAVADVVRAHLIGAGPMFPSSASPLLSPLGIIIAVTFGLLGGGLAVLLTRAIYGMEDLFHKLPVHWMWWPAIGGLIIGIGGLIVPQSLGVGYVSIAQLVQGHMLLSLAIGILVVKSLIWVGALSSGTSGGILAPLLIIGGALGDALAQLLHFPGHGAWAMLGMAAAFAGVTRSPLTTVVFILELTHDVDMLMPLLITSAIATALSATVLPRSILTEKIARRGLHIARDYAVDTLEQRLVKEVMTQAPTTLCANDTAEQAMATIVLHPERYRYDAYPLVDSKGYVVGVASLKALLAHAGDPKSAPKALQMLFTEPFETITPDDTLRVAIEKMAVGTSDLLLILDDTSQCVGIVTRSDIIKARQRQLDEETVRVRYFPFVHKARDHGTERIL
ncbi:MAG: chloride channel protein [Firmicutes bacterium]|nr:chloride channel protein [Bacillota bacterium]